MLRRRFILQRKKQEAQRKRIEAQGGFSEDRGATNQRAVLEWKGIEATEKLAMSRNAKVIVIGNPKNGLPLVLEPSYRGN